jgi:pyridoxine 5-phosphate synthase
MTKLSVNVNKIATLRNARGGDVPNLVRMAKDIEAFGGQGITVHPRPDERHIRRQDVFDLKQNISTEFNIEGYPTDDFIDLVLQVKPTQVTLVPDLPGQLTSDHGWDTIAHYDFLREVVARFQSNNIRVSIFVDPKCEMVEGASAVGADRVELYTAMYAHEYFRDRDVAIHPYVVAAERAKELGLGLNAGHDLSLDNLAFFHQQIPWLDEVSIGHALVSDALYLGMKNTVMSYLKCLE